MRSFKKKIGLLFLLAPAAALPIGSLQAAEMMGPRYCVPYCPPAVPNYCIPDPLANPTPATPETNETAEQFPYTPYDLGESAAAQTGNNFAFADTPAFIGDFFGGGSGGYSIIDSTEENIPSPGYNTGRQKLVENSSPIPRTRVFFNYSYYNNVQFTPYSVNVNQYVFGAEKSIWDGMASVEFRLPFASTLDSDINFANTTAERDTEFGNIPIYAKFRLLQGDSYVIGGGMGVTLPTADDVSVYDNTGTFINIQNQAVHLLPYIGGVYQPNDRFYSQFLLQIDVDTNGNTVYFDNGGGLAPVGQLQDSTFLFASLNIGYWLYRGDETERISGISPVMELHYNKTLNPSDYVDLGFGTVIGNATVTDFEMINLVAGVNIEMFRTTYVSLAYVAPLTQGADRAFDGEFRVLINRYYW